MAEFDTDAFVRQMARILVGRQDLNPTFSIGPLSPDHARGLLNRGTEPDLGQIAEDAAFATLKDPNYYISSLLNYTHLSPIVGLIEEAAEGFDLVQEARDQGVPPSQIAALVIGQTIGTNQLIEGFSGVDRDGHVLSKEAQAQRIVEGWGRLVRTFGALSGEIEGEVSEPVFRSKGTRTPLTEPVFRDPALRSKQPKTPLESRKPSTPHPSVPSAEPGRMTTPRTGAETDVQKLGGKEASPKPVKRLVDKPRKHVVWDLSRERPYDNLMPSAPESEIPKTNPPKQKPSIKQPWKQPASAKSIKIAPTKSQTAPASPPKTVDDLRGTRDRLGAQAPAKNTPTSAPVTQEPRPVRRGEPFKKSVQERLIDAEQSLADYREETAEYFRQRKAAKKVARGGLRKASITPKRWPGS